MARTWYRSRPQLLEAIRDDLERNYRDLCLIERNGTVLVCGAFPIVHDGDVLDRYRIEIEFPNDYPKTLPTVREVGGRIPWTLERHVLPFSGVACVFVGEDWLLEVGAEPSFLQYLDGPVRNFFLGQSLVEAGHPWPFGVRSHGKLGVLEAYGEWFGTVDEATIVRYLDCLSQEGLKGHWTCPCGSGRRVRHCHRDELGQLRTRIPVWLASRARQRLRYLNDLEARLAVVDDSAGRSAGARGAKGPQGAEAGRHL